MRKTNIHRKTTILLLFIATLLACLALSPGAQALTPAPDGGYPNQNTAEGDDALFSLTTGSRNAAVGFDALYSDTDGLDNTAVGGYALFSNTRGTGNTAIGTDVLYSNTTGSTNTASGLQALFFNTTGGSNTANGHAALVSNITGSFNTASGDDALVSNTTGNLNTANGADALGSNTIGNRNTADGAGALFYNTTGSNNIALGINTGQNLTNGDNNIDIGNDGVADDADTIRIGTQGTQTKTFVAGINGAAVTGTAVKINAAGQLGTAPSSARFKEEIKPMDKASEAILALKPVTFRYKKAIDPERTPQFGLVAEDVEKVNPNLVARDRDGKPYTVRYDAVNAMLLNEFLKQHKKVLELNSTVAKQEAVVSQQRKDFETAMAQQQKNFQSRLAEQEKQIEALAAGVQKVSAQLAAANPSRGGLEMSRSAPQVVLNKR